MRNIICILLIGLFSSCNSLLDVESETMVSFDNFYKSEQDLEVSLYQLQSFIHDRLLTHNVQEEAGMIMELNSNRDYLWEASSMLGTSGVGSITTDWTQHYFVVYQSNAVLDNIYKAEKRVTPERINYYKAQAYFGRAIGYFFLARRWGEVPVTRNSSSSEAYGKKPYLEVLDSIIVDATRAYDGLPVYGQIVDRQGAVIQSKQFGSKGAACALLAHVYAWKGSMIDLMELNGDSRACYDKAIEYASYLINGDVGNYQLTSGAEELCQLFSDVNKNNPESIWEFTLDMSAKYILTPYLVGRSLIGYPVDPQVSEGSQQYMSSKIALSTVKQLYDTLDTRLSSYFYDYEKYSLDVIKVKEEWTAGMTDPVAIKDTIAVRVKYVRDSITKITGGYVYPYKWREAILETNPNIPWITKLAAVSTNYSYWRLSDIYLLRAECYAKIGGNGLAEADLNQIRSRRNVKSYPQSKGDEKGLKYAIFHERERELLMEGHRFYDVARNGLEYINTYLPSAFQTLTLADVKNGGIFYAIIDKAFEQNNLLVQNTYWSQFKN